MRVVNRLTKPGDIRRVDLNSDTVRVVFTDGTEKVYHNLQLDQVVSEPAITKHGG